MMRRFLAKVILVFGLLFAMLGGVTSRVGAQEIEFQYETGMVTEVLEEQSVPTDRGTFYVQQLRVKSNKTGEVHEISAGSQFQPLNENQRLRVGNQVVLSDQELSPDAQKWIVTDAYRIPLLVWLAFGFFALVFVVAGFKGALSIVGMFISLGVLMLYIVPTVLAGGNPLVASLIGCGVIGATTIYLSHGFGTKSHIALSSMMATLVVVTLLAWWYVGLAKLIGLGNEEAYFLQYGPSAAVNLQGLLLGGIILGALGVLDDITVSQVATVFELKKANGKQSFRELYDAGMRVGRDHVASLVNTLVLAYAGANLPLFLLFSLAKQTPAWVHINTELLAEEIVRTLVGSIGLVLAVPLTTALSAYWAHRGVHVPQSKHSHTH